MLEAFRQGAREHPNDVPPCVPGNCSADDANAFANRYSRNHDVDIRHDPGQRIVNFLRYGANYLERLSEEPKWSRALASVLEAATAVELACSPECAPAAAVTGALAGLRRVLGVERGAINTGAQGLLASGDSAGLLRAGPMARHHIFNVFRGSSPQSAKYRDFFRKHKIDLDAYTVDVPKAMHVDEIHVSGHNWTTTWKRWIDDNPGATRTEVFQQGGRMMDEWGLSGLPIKRYRDPR